MIQVVGHKNPDTDSICAALVTAELLKARGHKAQAISQGDLSRETLFVLKKADVTAPKKCLTVAGKKVWLVDHTDMAQAPSDISDAEILGIVDHHRLGDITTVNPLEAWIWPVGCTCTILYNLFVMENHPISETNATLMLSAILSDTVGFASPTCTQKDREAVSALALIAKIDDLDAFIKELLIAKTDIAGLTAAQLVEKDLKEYPFNDRQVIVGQIELADLAQVSSMNAAINAELERRCSDDNLAFACVMLTDITTSTTQLLFKGEWSSKLDEFVVDGKLMLENTLSRKKQGWPWLQAKLK